jgi:hypothetical protein
MESGWQKSPPRAGGWENLKRSKLLVLLYILGFVALFSVICETKEKLKKPQK